MYNIVTIICVDTSEEDAKIFYPSSKNVSQKERRHTYWQMAYTSIASSVRCNPDKNHLIYTNDEQDVIIHGVDLRKRLHEIGVKIVYFPYIKFNPGKYARLYKNAMYKLSVCMDFANYDQPSVYIDSDCLWVRPNHDFDVLLTQSPLLLVIDICGYFYAMEKPWEKTTENLTIKDLGECFKNIDPNYPEQYPVYYGGEVVGGSPSFFKELNEEMQSLFDFLMEQASKEIFYYINVARESTQKGKDEIIEQYSMFDSDQLVNSFIYNKSRFKNRLFSIENLFSRRIFSHPMLNEVYEHDTKLTIWHMLHEKHVGLPLIYQEAINPDSDFWKVPIQHFAAYLGKYVGIPKREKYPSMKYKLAYALANVYVKLGSPRFLISLYQKLNIKKIFKIKAS
jgi:hypothetical protein